MVDVNTSVKSQEVNNNTIYTAALLNSQIRRCHGSDECVAVTQNESLTLMCSFSYVMVSIVTSQEHRTLYGRRAASSLANNKPNFVVNNE